MPAPSHELPRMNSRQRMLAALEYDSPDRIPVVYHPSPAGLQVHGRKLLDLFARFPPDNPVSFDEAAFSVPRQGYHELREDAWGTEWEYLIYGIHGHPHRYPSRPKHCDQSVHTEALDLATDEITHPRLGDTKQLGRLHLGQGPLCNQRTQRHHEIGTHPEVLRLLRSEAQIPKHIAARALAPSLDHHALLQSAPESSHRRKPLPR